MEMIVDCAVYQDGHRRDGKVSLEEAYRACRREGAFVWIGLVEPTADEFQSIEREFKLHELAVEDAIKAHQRPKLEVYGDTIFVVLKTARYVDPQEVVQLGEIGIFLGEGFVITVRHGEGSSLAPIRERLEQQPELLRCGTGAVLHAIVDRVVDDYQPAIDGLAVDIEQVEEQVFSDQAVNPAQRIYRLEREVLEMQRAVVPLAAPVDRLARKLMEAALEWRAAGPPKPPVRGDRLASELGIEPGPELGAIMAALAEAAYTGEATSQEEAVAYARRLRQNS